MPLYDTRTANCAALYNPGMFATTQITLNGCLKSLGAPCSISTLLEQEGLAGKRVAVEKNGGIVPKSLHADTLLRQGDQLEIVIAVGGG